jgi:hypothetical protein
MRITPNIFTISEFDKLAVYMLENNISAESCNILHRPSMLRMELLPNNIRSATIEKIQTVVDDYQLEKVELVNQRLNTKIKQSAANIIVDYLNFLKSYQIPTNIEQDRQNLVRFIKGFEQLRRNRILDYLPEYTEFLRDYGY